MITIFPLHNIKFYEFLIGDLSIEDFESFVCSDPHLEQQLGANNYLELISFNFCDKYVIEKLSEFIIKTIIQESEFETWKLKRILNNFLKQPEKLDINLNKIYCLYYGKYQEDGIRKYAYKFLGNLGLNHLYWAEECYLVANFGENWYAEYNSIKNQFEFYHRQLQNFAKEVLSAIETKEIEILDDGTYNISTKLKIKLETDDIYILKHPNKQYGS